MLARRGGGYLGAAGGEGEEQGRWGWEKLLPLLPLLQPRGACNPEGPVALSYCSPKLPDWGVGGGLGQVLLPRKLAVGLTSLSQTSTPASCPTSRLRYLEISPEMVLTKSETPLGPTAWQAAPPQPLRGTGSQVRHSWC